MKADLRKDSKIQDSTCWFWQREGLLNVVQNFSRNPKFLKQKGLVVRNTIRSFGEIHLCAATAIYAPLAYMCPKTMYAIRPGSFCVWKSTKDKKLPKKYFKIITSVVCMVFGEPKMWRQGPKIEIRKKQNKVQEVAIKENRYVTFSPAWVGVQQQRRDRAESPVWCRGGPTRLVPAAASCKQPQSVRPPQRQR